MAVLNDPLASDDPGPKAVVFSSRHATAACFINSSKELQYIYGPHPEMNGDNTKLVSLSDSLYNRTDFLPGLGQIHGAAFGFCCAIISNSQFKYKTFRRGEILTTASLAGTSSKPHSPISNMW